MAARIAGLPALDRLLDARYRLAVRTHRATLPALDGLDRAIHAGLERDGVYTTSLEALGLTGSAEIVATAQALARDYAETARQKAAQGQAFIMLPAMAALLRPALFCWGLDERLLNIAENYIGLPPAYDGMAILYTVAGTDEQATRRWHRDREDRRMMKVAVYLNDVDLDGGPFELDPRAATAAAVDPAAAITCTGPTGTVVFADTARFFHRGRPGLTHDRAAIFYSYFAQRPRRPFFCERSGLTRAQVAALTRDVTPRQAASARWHDALPLLVRAIPSAPI
jgi:hypothetical protein